MNLTEVYLTNSKIIKGDMIEITAVYDYSSYIKVGDYHRINSIAYSMCNPKDCFNNNLGKCKKLFAFIIEIHVYGPDEEFGVYIPSCHFDYKKIFPNKKTLLN